MDKDLLHIALAKINAAPAGAPVPLCADEASLLEAFLGARRKGGGISGREKALLGRVRDVLAAWNSLGPSADERERRQQWMVRKAIDKLQDKNVSPTSDDLYLLQATRQDLSSKPSPGKADERMLSMIEDALSRYNARKLACENSKPSDLEFPYGGIEQWATVITAKPPQRETPVNRLQATVFFQGVTPAPVEFLGGCGVAMTVRTFEVTGPTVITGDIPNDVLLRVKQGSLTVEGFVSGHIVADGDIIIQGNVQGGWVVATKGSIVIQKALVGSRVVAEGGAVWCTNVEAAACVFGWKGVAVRETVLSSTLAGRCAWVGDKIAGTEVEVCGPVVAHAVESAGHTPSVLCLRHEVCSEVYGRHITEDMRALRRNVGQQERALQTGTRMIRFVSRLSAHCYRTAIFYLVGGVEVASVAADFQDLQSLALQLEELVEIGESVSRFYEDVFAGSTEIDPEEVDLFTAETAKSLAYISQQAESAGRDLQSHRQSLVLDCIHTFAGSLRFIHKNLSTPRAQTHYQGVFLNRMREWRELRATTKKKVDDLVLKFEVHPDLLERVQREHETLDQILSELLAQSSAIPASEEARRAQSPLIRVLVATVERNRRGVQHEQEQMTLARAEVARLRAKLAEAAIVLFADSAQGTVYAEAARVDAGTVLTTAPHLRQGLDGTLRDVIVVAQPVQPGTRFVLENSVLRRVEPHPPSVAAAERQPSSASAAKASQ